MTDCPKIVFFLLLCKVKIFENRSTTRRMKALSLFLVAALFAVSCSRSGNSGNRGKNSGGTLKLNESDNIVSLFPPSTKDIVSFHLVNQIHLGLVKYDVKNLAVLAGIAKDWEVDNSGTIYTFHLNTAARFQNDDCFAGGEGRKITANDFKYTFTYLASQSNDNKNFFGTVDRIVGAKQYYKNSAEGKPQGSIEGIKVVNDSTLQIIIEKPYDLFLYNLANPAAVVLAKEAVEKYGNKLLVGAGAFQLKSLAAQGEPLILTRNENYFITDEKGFTLPYLDSVVFTFHGSLKTEIRMFVDNQLDVIMGMGNDYVNEFLDTHIDQFESNPPVYILNRAERLSNRGEYYIIKASVNNFYTNKMDNMDLSMVYLRAPEASAEGKKAVSVQ